MEALAFFDRINMIFRIIRILTEAREVGYHSKILILKIMPIL